MAAEDASRIAVHVAGSAAFTCVVSREGGRPVTGAFASFACFAAPMMTAHHPSVEPMQRRSQRCRVCAGVGPCGQGRAVE